MYGLSVRPVDTHHKSRRTIFNTIVCGSREQKWERIADETRAVIKARRAVLIGTRSDRPVGTTERTFSSLCDRSRGP